MNHPLTDDDVRWADRLLMGMLYKFGLRGHDLEDRKQDLMMKLLDLAPRWSPMFSVPFRMYIGYMLKFEVLRTKRHNHHGLVEEMLPVHKDSDPTGVHERAARVRAACRTERERDVVTLLSSMPKFEVAQTLGISKQYVQQIVERIRERVLKAEGGAS